MNRLQMFGAAYRKGKRLWDELRNLKGEVLCVEAIENTKLKSALFVIATGAEKTGIRTKMNMQDGENPERLDDAEYRKLAVEIVFNRLRHL